MIGIVSKEDFDKELGVLDEGRAEIVQMPKPGRKAGDINIPEVLRKVIGENAVEEGSKETKELTASFGVSDSSLSAYKNGATSTASYNQPNHSLGLGINKVKTKITTRAQSRLLKAIHHITNEKLQEAKPRDLAGIAKDLAVVVKTMEPETPKVPPTNNPTFVFFTPPQKREEQYETIVLKE